MNNNKLVLESNEKVIFNINNNFYKKMFHQMREKCLKTYEFIQI